MPSASQWMTRTQRTLAVREREEVVGTSRDSVELVRRPVGGRGERSIDKVDEAVFIDCLEGN